MKKLFALLLAVLVVCTAGSFQSADAQQIGATTFSPSRGAGYFYAPAYGRYLVHLFSAAAASSGSLVLTENPSMLTISSTEGRTFNPFGFGNAFPQVQVDVGASSEAVTVSGVAGCSFGNSSTFGVLGTCVLTTSSLSNAHAPGAVVFSATFGLQEALIDALKSGGGIVVVDQTWALLGGTTGMITSAATGNLSTVGVWILDLRGPAPRWYGKSGAGTAVYSDTNNDIVGSGASPLSKTFSTTYAAAPICTSAGTTGAATATTSTTTTVAVTCTGTCSYHCDF